MPTLNYYLVHLNYTLNLYFILTREKFYLTFFENDAQVSFSVAVSLLDAFNYSFFL
ncbi:hypothetical protein QE357_001524 [Siphonobacter sp. BAB-5404]|nr:hypothetical protein [Siphonobacter sp. SORGH_AS_0500]